MRRNDPNLTVRLNPETMERLEAVAQDQPLRTTKVRLAEMLLTYALRADTPTGAAMLRGILHPKQEHHHATD